MIVLGASGWLGQYLVPLLSRSMPEVSIAAGFNIHRPVFSDNNVEAIQISSQFPQKLGSIKTNLIINLARGEQEIDFDFHRSLIDYANKNNARYIFASSSNAVDADVSKPHLETDAPASQTEYGKFKGQCEQELFKSCNRPLAFRFAGTHGWAANRMARTEEFLIKLSSLQEIPVALGVIQNRSFIGDLVHQICLLAADENAEGVFHLGTCDSSEELDFFRKLAEAFGFDSHQVVAGENMNWNMVTVPTRIEKYLKLPTEKQTIEKVRAQPELSKYVK